MYVELDRDGLLGAGQNRKPKKEQRTVDGGEMYYAADVKLPLSFTYKRVCGLSYA